MPSIKRSSKAVEVKTGFETYDGPMPGRGMYRGRITKLAYREYGTGTTGLQAVVILEAVKGDPKNHAQFDGYTAFGRVFFTDSEQAQARESNFYAALGLKDNPTIVTEDGDISDRSGVTVTKIGGKNPVGAFVNVDLRVSRDRDGEMEVDGMYKVKEISAASTVRNSSPVSDDAADEDDDLMEDEAEDETAEEEEAEESEEDAEVIAREAELTKLTLAKLRAEAKNLEIDTTGLKKDELISEILDAEFGVAEEEDESEEDEEAEEEEEDEAEEEEEEEEEGDDQAERKAELDALDRTGLKKILKGLQPDFVVRKNHSDDDLVAAILDSEFGDETPF
jgi:hypothetical protein